MSAEIFYSYTGKWEDAALYAYCSPVVGQNIEDWAMSLWYDLRQRQRDDGQNDLAAVWIGDKKFKPTVEQIEAHEEKLRKLRAEEEFFRGTPDADDDEGWRPYEPAAADDGEPARDESRDVAAAEDEEEAEPDSDSAGAGDGEVDEQPLTSIMLEEADDLDF